MVASTTRQCVHYFALPTTTSLSMIIINTIFCDRRATNYEHKRKRESHFYAWLFEKEYSM